MLENVKPYDFRRPEKFSKEHLRAIRLLHDSFARTLASAFSSYLHGHVLCHLANMEQLTYDEYIGSLETPTAIYVVLLDPLPGKIVVEMDLILASAMVDRLLGGIGRPARGSGGEMTEIELLLMKRLGDVLLSALRDTWSSILDVQPSCHTPVLTPEFVQITLRSEATVALSFEMVAIQAEGKMSICIPYPVLHPILDTILAHIWSSGLSQSEAEDAPVNPVEQLNDVPVPVVAELGRARLSVGDVLDLKPGQIIKLDTPADDDVTVRVGDHLRLNGRPGLKGRNLAVQITRSIGTGG